MKIAQIRTLMAAGVVAMIALAGAGPAFSKDPVFPGEAEVKRALDQNAKDLKDLRKSIPKDKKQKEIEEVYHKKQVEAEEALANLRKVRADPKATKKDDEKALEAASQAGNQADIAAVRAVRYGNAQYRKALRNVRSSRAALKKLREKLLTDKSKAGTQKRRKIGKALRDSNPANITSTIASGGFFGGRSNSKVATNSALRNTISVTRGSVHRPKCDYLH